MKEFRETQKRVWASAWCLFFFLSTYIMAAEPGPSIKERVFKDYSAAREEFAKKPDDFAAACNLADLAFDWADYSPNDNVRETLANEGIAAASKAIKLNPKAAAGYHLLALNTGQLARTKSLGALRLVKEMEKAFKKAAELEPTYAQAGPDRSLGILYQEAPGWPTSIGSKSKARLHLKKALQLAGTHPDNHLSYMEALLEWKEKEELVPSMKRYEAILQESRTLYTDPKWEGSWVEWEKRWTKIKAAALEL